MWKAAACGLACAVAISASVARADTRRARIVTRDAAPGLLHVPVYHRHSFMIERPIVEPAAVVSRALADQPVWPHLIEVSIFGTQVYLDPDENYENQGALALDEDHFINRAQRMARKLRSPGPRVIVNSIARRGRSNAVTIKPHMIFRKPDTPRQIAPRIPYERIASSD